jgi:peptide/nickel transport system ATP-binding protein
MVYPGPDARAQPVAAIGRQLSEVFELGGTSKGEARERSEAALRRVQIADPGSVLDRYPRTSCRAAWRSVS